MASYEVELNLVIHSLGGQMEITIEPDSVTLDVSDRGPGIPDLDLAMQEGWSLSLIHISAAVRAAYQERVRTEPPFVGMYIKDIDNTPLGEGKISDHERRYVDGKLVDIYIYDYCDE